MEESGREREVAKYIALYVGYVLDNMRRTYESNPLAPVYETRFPLAEYITVGDHILPPAWREKGGIIPGFESSVGHVINQDGSVYVHYQERLQHYIEDAGFHVHEINVAPLIKDDPHSYVEIYVRFSLGSPKPRIGF